MPQAPNITKTGEDLSMFQSKQNKLCLLAAREVGPKGKNIWRKPGLCRKVWRYGIVATNTEESSSGSGKAVGRGGGHVPVPCSMLAYSARHPSGCVLGRSPPLLGSRAETGLGRTICFPLGGTAHTGGRVQLSLSADKAEGDALRRAGTWRVAF